MISVILVEPPQWPKAADQAYLCARSMPWLVSAVVGGFVRDLVIALEPTTTILDLAERVGCAVTLDGAKEPFRAALAQAKSPLILALQIGFEPIGDLAAELDRYAVAEKALPVLLETEPARSVSRFLKRPPIVGGLAKRDTFVEHGRAVLRRQRRPHLLNTRMRPVD